MNKFRTLSFSPFAVANIVQKKYNLFSSMLSLERMGRGGKEEGVWAEILRILMAHRIEGNSSYKVGLLFLCGAVEVKAFRCRLQVSHFIIDCSVLSGVIA